MNMQKCIRCKVMLPKSAFIKKFTYLGKKCYECLKKENRLHAKKIKDAVKKASGDCWWIEKWCLASIQYHGTKRK